MSQDRVRSITDSSPASEKVVRRVDDIVFANPAGGSITLGNDTGDRAPIEGLHVTVYAGTAATAERTVTWAGRSITKAYGYVEACYLGGAWRVRGSDL